MSPIGPELSASTTLDSGPKSPVYDLAGEGFSRTADYGFGGTIIDSETSGKPPQPPSGDLSDAGGEHFKVHHIIGQGGMGVVYLAKDLKLDRWVALKRLSSKILLNPQAKERFDTEAKLLGSLNHSHIVQIYQMEEDSAGLFIAMEYVEGPEDVNRPDWPAGLPRAPLNLHELIVQRDVLTTKAAATLLAPICRAAHFAHLRKVVHRDIKPANILVGSIESKPQAKLADFGLARRVNPENRGMTQAGDRLITVGYGAPEQLVNPADVDFRADIYSLGATLWFLVTRRDPVYFRESEVDPNLRPIIRKAMQTEPKHRYESAELMAQELEGLAGASVFTLPNTLQSEGFSNLEGMVLELGQCSTCGHRHLLSSQGTLERSYCERCGASLIEPCLSCGAENASWVQYCGACGQNLLELFQKEKARLDAECTAIDRLVAENQVDSATARLQELPTPTHPRLQPFARRTEQAIEQLQQTKQGVEAARNAAAEWFETLANRAWIPSDGDLRRLIALLEAIPEPARTAPEARHLQDAASRIAEVHRLQQEIHEGLSNNQYEGLLDKAKRIQELAPLEHDPAVRPEAVESRLLLFNIRESIEAKDFDRLEAKLQRLQKLRPDDQKIKEFCQNARSNEQKYLRHEVRQRIVHKEYDRLLPKVQRLLDLTGEDQKFGTTIAFLEQHERKREQKLWARVCEAPTIENLKTFLAEFPQGRYLEDARENLALLLRAELLGNLRNRLLRQDYLACRTEVLEVQDHSRAQDQRLLVMTLTFLLLGLFLCLLQPYPVGWIVGPLAGTLLGCLIALFTTGNNEKIASLGPVPLGARWNKYQQLWNEFIGKPGHTSEPPSFVQWLAALSEAAPKESKPTVLLVSSLPTNTLPQVDWEDITTPVRVRNAPIVIGTLAVLCTAVITYSWITQEPTQPELSGTLSIPETLESDESEALVEPSTPWINLFGIADQKVNEEELLEVRVSARQTQDPDLKYRFELLPGSPEGTTIDPESGDFSWTPNESQGPGDYEIQVGLIDPEGHSIGGGQFRVQVLEVPQSPQILNIDDQEIVLGNTAILQPRVIDPDIPQGKLVYRFLEELPGAALDSSTGRIQWTPTIDQAGKKFPVRLMVSKVGNEDLSADTDFSFSVAIPAKELAQLRDPNGSVFCLAASPDGTKLYSGGQDGNLRVWDLRSPNHPSLLPAAHKQSINSLVVTPDDRWLISSSAKGRNVFLSDTKQEQPDRQLPIPIQGLNVTSVGISPNGFYALTGTANHYVKRYNIIENKELQSLKADGPIQCVAFSPNGRQFAAGSSPINLLDSLGSLYLWSLDGDTERPFAETGRWRTTSIAFLPPEGERLVSGNDQGAIHLWDVETKKLEKTIPGHEGKVTCLLVTLNGKGLLSGGIDGTLRLWNIETGQEIHRYNGHNGSINGLVILHPGYIFASAGNDGTIRIWGLPENYIDPKEEQSN